MLYSFQHTVLELRRFPLRRGAQEFHNDRVRFARFRRELRMKQSRDEEFVVWGFNRVRFALRSPRNDGKSRLDHRPLEFRIHLVVTEKFLCDDVFLVERMKIGSRTDANFWNWTGQLWLSRCAVGNGTCHGMDDNVLRSGIILCRIGVFNVHHISRTLYQSVLEAPSSADKGPVSATRKLNASQHSVETLVGTAGGGPEPVKIF